MSEALPHRSEDRFWTEALDGFVEARDRGGRQQVTLDLERIEACLFETDLAFRLMDAMCSVKAVEGLDGCRGAPQLVLALLHIWRKTKALCAEADRLHMCNRKRLTYPVTRRWIIRC